MMCIGMGWKESKYNDIESILNMFLRNLSLKAGEVLESLNMILQSALQAVWMQKPIFRRPFDLFPTSQTLKNQL